MIVARAELDEAKCAKMYVECQRLAQDDSGTIYLMFTNYILASSKRVSHWSDVAPKYELDAHKA